MFSRTHSVIRTGNNVAILIIALVAAITFSQRLAYSQPTLPLVTFDTTYIPPTGQTIFVPAGGDLQSALNNAQPGYVIALQAGATFTGNFVLPNKGGTNWIVIRSSAPDTSLPPPGTRITPAYSSVMPKIVSPNTLPAITTALGANHYRFIGVEITTTQSDTSSTNYNLIWLEYAVNGMSQQTSLSQAPTDIIFDRTYIHGTPTGNVRRGIFMNSARTAVIDSYLSDFHEIGADTQAILICNGPGPFKITNNYLEGAGENFMSGGCDPLIPNLVPSDIEIRANHFFKPLKWRLGDPSYAGIHWSVKNLFELKNAQRVLIDGNIFENNWADAQAGIAIQLTPRNQDGAAPWSVVQDVTFTNNIVRHSGSGVNLLGWDNINSSQQQKRVLIKNNLFEDIGSNWGGSGILFQLLNGTAEVVIDHNTGLHSGNIILADGAANTGFVYQNNLTPHNLYGVIGTGTGVGSGTLAAYFPGYVFARNVLAGGNASSYPPDNFFPASLNEVGFLNLSGGDYHLSLSSPYNNVGTDGTDVGVDFDALLVATQDVIDGATVNPPPPADTTAPLISAVSTPLISSAGGTVSWTTNEASDSQVEYGLTTAYGSSTALNLSMLSSHSQSLNALSSNTLYHYRVKSRDAAGNLAASTDFTFSTLAQADVTAPTVSVSAPTADSTVSGMITVSAGASDNVGVAGVQFKLDGADLGAENTTAPYSISWNTTTATNGSHTLTAVARDAAGNTATSSVVTVTVTNTALDTTPPAISSVAASSITSSGATITWTTNEASDSQGEYGPTTVYSSSTPLNTNLVISHSVTLSGLSPNTVYHYRVKSRDAAGNPAVSADQTFTTLAATGTRSPFKGAPFAVPGLIEAEDFDNGGEGVAYHDMVPGNAGGLYRLNEDVDITANGTGYAVNNIQTGEWLSYSINVAQIGTYRIEAAVSSEFTTSRWHVEIDGVDKTGPVLVPNTSSWQTFQFIGVSGVSLTAGLHILKIYAEQEYFNLDAIQILTESVGSQAVIWTNPVNVTVTGNSLQKISGCDGCDDAGATSQQQLTGDGYVEFTASETGALRYIGLSNGNTSTSAAEIDFAVALGFGWAEVRENGVYKANAPLVTGDLFRIAVESGVVNYYQNGVPFYTSAIAPTYPLAVTATLWNLGATINNAVIPAAVSPSGPQNVIWANPVNVTVTGNSLQKISGCDGCDDAGATSQQQLTGDGYVEFTASETGALRYIGLSNGNASTSAAEIDFAVALGFGWAEVRENGVYKANAPLVTGDLFRIAVESGVVNYYQNGALFYTSTIAPTYPLLADASLISLNATTTNAVIYSGTVVASSSPTTPIPSADTSAPVISLVSASNVSSSGATITWTANEASDSQVEYGTTTAYGNSTPLNATLVTSHSVTLSALAANTLYHYRVKSRDAAGNVSVSGDFTFKTKRRFFKV